MRVHYENALAVAQFLEGNERVEKVRYTRTIDWQPNPQSSQVLYPALPSHPQYEVHKKQTKGMSGMMSFYLKGGMEEAQRFFDAINVFIFHFFL